MNPILQDLRQGVRILWKKPGFTFVAVVTLGLGIGANTAIFSVVNAVLLRPFSYRDPDRVVTLWQNNVKAGVPRNDVAPANFLDWREQARSFEGMAGIEPFGFSLIDRGEPERFQAFLVTSSFFEVLGAPALLGRTFTAEEYRPGNDRVVVLGHGLWKRRFGGDPGLVGQSVTLNGQPYKVLGVMGPEFQFPVEREVWAPRPLTDRDRQLRGPTYWNVVARLKPGVSVEQAQGELDAISARLAREYPDTNGGMGATVVTLPELLTGPVRGTLMLLLAAVGFVLLIACANVASLLLVRALERRREFAIRAALGAGRARLVSQLLAESALLALSGGVLGLLLARWGIRLILAFGASQIPRLEHVSLDTRVLLFVCALSLLTAILFGLIPAAQSSRGDLQSGLNEGGRSAASAPVRSGLRNALVVAEVGLSVVLLTGAGLLVRSFEKLLRVDPGFSKESVLALQVFLVRNYQTPEKITGFFDQTLEKVSQAPGVRAAAAVSSPPFIKLEQDTPFSIEGDAPPAPGREPTAFYSVVSADYIRVMGIPLRIGRFFTTLDRRNTVPVVVINESMARRYFPRQDAVGHRIKVLYERPEVREIVGVVGDVLHSGLDASPRPEMFVPYPQSPSSHMTFVVKTSGDPSGMLARVKASIREVNRNQTFSKTASMADLVNDSLRQRSFSLFLLGFFAVLALALASIGIYGLVSYSARQRTHEIGVRMALGARPSDVLALVVGLGLKWSLAGVALGLLGSIALTRSMKGLLFGVSATDPVTFAAIVCLLISVALVASWIPARRAMRVDPVVALCGR